MRHVVSNTGPVLHLYEAQALHLLHAVGAVHIPKAVYTELLRYHPAWHTQRPDWILVDTLASPHATAAALWQQAGLLDAGEAEAIALMQQVQAQWFLTDEVAARVFASALGFEVHGSLGIVLWAAAIGHLQRAEAAETLERLAQSSLWISPRVFAEAHRALSHLFPEA